MAHKLTPFPNGMGYEFKTTGGYWELWKPDPEAHINHWRAVFRDTGHETVKYGEGATYAEAMHSARPIEVVREEWKAGRP